MRIITDWHLHSKYSRACSQDLTLENNALWCEKKGVNVLGTADFTHPKWFAEIKEKLEERESGMFGLKGSTSSMRYMLTTEIAQIYKKDGAVRRIHNIVLAPSIADVEAIINALTDRGCNLSADGRPIIGIESEELMKILMDIDEKILLIPAHAWTPWFSVFGSKSGFKSLEACYGSMTKYIYAIETGLSSDPAMNRRLSALDNVMLISNSDAHSPRNFGREANVFEMDPNNITYDEFRRILVERDTSKFVYTIEFYPEEGKYHADGHADCQFYCDPAETKRLGGRCPKCGKKLTVGVLSRVEELADRPVGSTPSVRDPNTRCLPTAFKSIVPLEIIIAESLGLSGTASKKVQAMYDRLNKELGSEFSILLDVPIDDIKRVDLTVGEAVDRVRLGKLNIRPGYDGIFGQVHIFGDEDRPKQKAFL